MEKPTPVPGQAAETGRREPAVWAALVAACAGQFLVVLDVSVVNVALPSVRRSLGLDESGLQWVANAYTITFAGFMLLGGRAADLFGRKQVFLTGLGLFTAASLAGGLAQEPWQLIAARVVQGVGAAVLAPSTLTILTTSFPEGPARVRAIGLWTAVGTGGGAAGGLVGGLLTDALGWRWVLLINVPVGALVLAGTALWLTERRERAVRRRLDLPGAVLVTASVGAVAYGIAQTEAHGWTDSASLLPLLGGLAGIAAFTAVEARSAEPLMPLRLFRVRSVWTANTVFFVCGTGFFAMWYFMSLYLQNVLGFSPVEAGCAFLPHTLSIIIGSQLAPRLMNRIEPRTLIAVGGLLAVAGFGWQSTMGADGTFLRTVLGPAVLMSFGAGLLMTPLASVATSGVAAGEMGAVSGLVNTARTVGGALGLSILATAAADRIASAAASGAAGPEALADGYAYAFRVAACFLLAGTLLVALLPRAGTASRPGGKPAEAARRVVST
ncbi:MFS transporter [Streptomyces sp. NPDC048845]|uniref:MFS transporter n=1 Tax=Streptomyces sp. NPDC048845 TaxID=3155390 RepID=UPI00341D2AC4